jgi:hypothetical protein
MYLLEQDKKSRLSILITAFIEWRLSTSFRQLMKSLPPIFKCGKTANSKAPGLHWLRAWSTKSASVRSFFL